MNLEIGSQYQVTVIKIVQCGAIVEAEDGSTHLIHVSKLSTKYVSDVSTIVNVGDKLTVVGIQGTARPVELSLKDAEIVDEKLEHKSLEDMLSESQAVLKDKMAHHNYKKIPKRSRR